MLLQATKLMTNAADAAIEPGWVRLEDGAVVEWGHGEADGPADRTYDEGLVAPGFVDIHCHGGNGGDFASGDADQIRRAQAFHAEHGTGAMLASLVTAPVDATERPHPASETGRVRVSHARSGFSPQTVST